MWVLPLLWNGQMGVVGSPAPCSFPAQVAYTGLKALDQQSAMWAIVYSNETKSYWKYPAAYLRYCDEELPGVARERESWEALQVPTCGGL